MILAILVVTAALLHFFPQWTRRDLFFAVTVDPGFEDTPAARHILRTYRILIWSSTGLAALLLFGAGALAAVIIEVAGSLVALGVARRQTFAHRAPPPPVVEVDLAARPSAFPWARCCPSCSLLPSGPWPSGHLLTGTGSRPKFRFISACAEPTAGFRERHGESMASWRLQRESVWSWICSPGESCTGRAASQREGRLRGGIAISETSTCRSCCGLPARCRHWRGPRC